MGAEAGSPNSIDMQVPANLEKGKLVAAQSGCLACHKIGENGGTLGPNLTHIGERVPRAAIVRSVEIGPGIMPSFRDLPQKKINEMADFLSSLD
jgi:cytochrome c2